MPNRGIKPPKELPLRLARLLCRLGNLIKLVFVVPQFHSDVFFEEFEKARVLLPQVETLVVGPFCEFAIAMCPSVKILQSNGWQWRGEHDDVSAQEHAHRLIKAAKGALELVHFEVDEACSISFVQSRNVVHVLL